MTIFFVIIYLFIIKFSRKRLTSNSYIISESNKFNLKYVYDVNKKLSLNVSKKLKTINIKNPYIAFKDKSIKVVEKKISLSDILNCKEAFITSASSFVTPVVQVDKMIINGGEVGKFSNLLRKTYLEMNN